jgi:hypothetical protein
MSLCVSSRRFKRGTTVSSSSPVRRPEQITVRPSHRRDVVIILLIVTVVLFNAPKVRPSLLEVLINQTINQSTISVSIEVKMLHCDL